MKPKQQGGLPFCDVCRRTPVSRRGVIERSSIKITYGLLCGSCAVFPFSSVSQRRVNELLNDDAVYYIEALPASESDSHEGNREAHDVQ